MEELVRHDQRIKEAVRRIEVLERQSVTRREFLPVKNFVYGALCFLICSLLSALFTHILGQLWHPMSAW
jgi:hypothetical protein